VAFPNFSNKTLFRVRTAANLSVAFGEDKNNCKTLIAGESSLAVTFGRPHIARAASKITTYAQSFETNNALHKTLFKPQICVSGTTRDTQTAQQRRFLRCPQKSLAQSNEPAKRGPKKNEEEIS
jgi:hypothetical protein